MLCYAGSDDDQLDDTPTGGYDDEKPTSGYDDAPSRDDDDEGPTSTYEDAPPPPTVDTTTEHSKTEANQVRNCIVISLKCGSYIQ